MALGWHVAVFGEIDCIFACGLLGIESGEAKEGFAGHINVEPEELFVRNSFLTKYLKVTEA